MTVRHEDPLVSIITPVYNGESYLQECLESVLSQTYSRIEHIIVDNFSTDRTGEIVEKYRAKDGRIRVCRNEALLPIIANHNKAFRLISPDSKYCKVVSADDWLYPECIERMVELAEAHPSVGIVGSYQLSGGSDKWYVRNSGLPYSTTVIPGREICRSQLLGTLSVFGTPTSTLYRSDLVRGTDAFYPNATAEADTSACFEHLKHTDYGFVHQVLSYERLHRVRQTTESLELNAYVPAAIADCMVYGPSYMTRSELDERVQELLKIYYKYLAVSALKLRDARFWEYHKKRLHELGFPLDRIRLSKGVSLKLLSLLTSPKETIELFGRRMRSRVGAGAV